jgi:hypothetical protein
MTNELIELVKSNASAIFGLLGVILGGSTTFITSYIRTKQDYRYKIFAKLIDRKIYAHEVAINLAYEMRVMLSPAKLDANNELVRYPQILASDKSFTNWFAHFTLEVNRVSSWLTVDVRRELNLIQDYICNIHLKLDAADSDTHIAVGKIVRQDFIDFSSELEQKAFQYFRKGVLKLDIGDINNWHKYDQGLTETRLKETQFFKNISTINELTE